MNLGIILGVSLITISCCLAVNYKEEYFDQTIDHFNFKTFGSRTFKQRYFYNDTWWDKKRGPIFFYAGNEVSLDSGWKFNGFLMDIAPSNKALVLFVEHRFYGKSLPFDKASWEAPKIGLLSIEQALADYATFLTAFKKEFEAENCPVIAFGGSYGGMLVAYMRFKYPNVIQGSIASSAPVYQTAGITSGDLFFQSVTQSFRNISSSCESRVRSAFRQLNEWVSEDRLTGLQKISETFRLCRPLTSASDYEHFLRWARNAFVVAAMINFPYDIGRFEAFPVKRMCDRLEGEDSSASGLRSACGVLYNTTGNSRCFDIYEEYRYCADPTNCGHGQDSYSWDYQACTEVNLEGDSNGVEDMFPALPFNASMRDKYCSETWNIKPRRDWLAIQYWGKDIASSSNIVFSNGNLDPWTPGGVLRDISDTIVAVMIEGGAHHLDLLSSHPADPQSVRDVRDFEVRHINKWIDEYHRENNVGA